MAGFTGYQPPQAPSVEETLRRLGYNATNTRVTSYTPFGGRSAAPTLGYSAPVYAGAPGNIPSSSGPFDPTAGTPTSTGTRPVFGDVGGGNRGGFYDRYGNWINAGVSLAGALSRGREKGRQEQRGAEVEGARFAQDEASAAERAVENRARLDLERRRFGQESQDRDYRNALRAALAMNFQNVSVNRPEGVPTIKFNLPGIGEEGRTAGREMYQRALESLMAGQPTFDALPPIERSTMPAYKGPGTLENILGAIGAGGGAYVNAQSQGRNQALIAALLEALQRNQQSSP